MKIGDLPYNTEAYARLASLWNQYAVWFVPDYAQFLLAAEKHFGLDIRRILDLACGTGLITRRLARQAESVVGLDVSEAMLQEARRLTTESNIRYKHGDFRAFGLDETFDAIVCGSDSLNYVEIHWELVDVFRCVERHLRPGGIFTFDVLNQREGRRSAGTKTVVDMAGEQFEIIFCYDPIEQVSEDRAVLEGAIERHRRISIEEEDVRGAADRSGLEVVERFSAYGRGLLWLLPYAWKQFYVLRKQT
jgi:2-polyprenyl-3-methyl-5-hydroxy-6-metoxy-1,4-benzoquinol methylase